MMRKKSKLLLKTVLVYMGLLIIGIIFATILSKQIIPVLPKEWQNKIGVWLGIAVPTISVLSSIAETLGYNIKSLLDPEEYISRTEHTSSERSLRIRRLMLEQVHNIWIEGILSNSLHGIAMLELGKKVQDDKINHPWMTVLKTFDASLQRINLDTKIADVFRMTNSALLILGEPGSGKTTTLLELAQSALCEAQKDPLAPIPVVFQLSSWSQTRKTIFEWLIDELRRQYGVNRIISQDWLKNQSLLLLLDGLDEVKETFRTTCVRELNEFRNEYGMTQIAISCRTLDYDTLPFKLNLNGAIILQELSDEQIIEYLDGVGSDLLAVRRTLELDREIRALARSPLFLSVMVLAYRGISMEELKTLNLNETRRNHIWRHYVHRMYYRRPCLTNYSFEQTKHWLSWLARSMTLLRYPVFFDRSMTDEWLDTPIQNFVSNFLTSICSFFVFGAFFGLISALLIAPNSAWIVYGPLLGMAIGLVYGSFMGIIIGTSRVQSLFNINVIFQGLLKKRQMLPQRKIYPKEQKSFQELIENGQQTLLEQNFFWNYSKSLLLVWFIIWVICGVFIILTILPTKVFTIWTVVGLSLGLYFLKTNEISVIESFILHILLFYSKYIPWDYSDFLNCSTNRIYLRKIGGGFMFIHPLLSKYFADQFPKSRGRFK